MTDVWYFGIWCESLVEVTAKFQIAHRNCLFKAFQSIATNCNNETVVELYRWIFYNNHEVT